MKFLTTTSAALMVATGVLPIFSAAQENIEEIVVTSSRIEMSLGEVGASVSVLTAEDIELRGYSTLVDALNTQSGIGVSHTGGQGQQTTLRIRGEEGYRTLVMIDGVEISDPTGTQVMSQVQHLLATSDIDRVEILKGAQGFMYGADAGGVINILTRRGEAGFEGRVSAEAGSFGARQLGGSLSGGTESLDYLLSVTDIGIDGFSARTDDVVLRDKDGYNNTTLHAKLGWDYSEALRLQLVARTVDSETEFDHCSDPFTWLGTDICEGRYDQETYKASADYRGEQLTHHLAWAYTDIERASLANGLNSYSTEGDINRLEYTGSIEPVEAITLVYGLDWEREDIVSSSGDDLERDQLGTYLEVQGRVADALFVTAGLRHDDNDDFGEHVSGRTTIAYRQNLADGASIKYRASYGTGFRAPSLSEIAYNNGSFAYPPASEVTLKEETSRGFDTGIDYYGADGVYLSVVYFDQKIQDEIYFDLSVFSGYLQDTGESSSRGVELTGEYPLNENWLLLGNFTYNDTEDSSGQQRIRRPEKIANLGVQYAGLNQQLRIALNLRISRDSQDEIFGLGRVPLDDYEMLDISATYDLNESLQLFGRVENATDRDYREVTNYNTAGVAGYTGVRFKF